MMETTYLIEKKIEIKKKWNWADGEMWCSHNSADKVWSHLVYDAK